MIPIQFMTGDATRPQGDGKKIITHVCNVKGLWGAGFTHALSRRWEEPEKIYHFNFHSDKGISFGDVQFVILHDEGDIITANMICEGGVRGSVSDYRRYLNYEYLSLCLAKVMIQAYTTHASVHMPRIGSGLAGGDWDLIQILIESHLGFFDIPVFVYDLPSR